MTTRWATTRTATHVVTAVDCESGATLDGCTVTAGFANGATCDADVNRSQGGGILVSNSDVTIHHCKFRDNHQFMGVYLMYPQCGGGAIFASGTLSATQCVFENNTATQGDSPVTDSHGGAIFTYGGAVIIDCTFTGNSAHDGGAVYDIDSSILENCQFAGNSAENAGACLTYDGTLNGCAFDGNVADGSGGALGGGNISAVNCTFTANDASSGGGAAASGSFINCLFSWNSASSGGGVDVNPPEAVVGSATFLHCTFADNVADAGRAIVCPQVFPFSPSSAALSNCILWDGGDEIRLYGDSTADVAYSDVYGGWPGAGNIDTDPLFVTGPAGCHYLSQSIVGSMQFGQSPCVDAGDSTAFEPGWRTTRSDQLADAEPVDMGYHYPLTVPSLLRGDFNRDGYMDIDDLAGFITCMSGPCADPPCHPTIYDDPCCNMGDFDYDGDVDLDDFAAFQREFGSVADCSVVGCMACEPDSGYLNCNSCLDNQAYECDIYVNGAYPFCWCTCPGCDVPGACDPDLCGE